MMDDQGNVYARDKEIDNVVEGQWTDCTPVSQAKNVRESVILLGSTRPRQ